MSRQLVLDLPLRTAHGRDDFLVTPSNAAAVAMIDRYPDWPHYGVVLVGAAGSGKSHLLEVWRQAANARRVTAADIGATPPDQLLATGALAIDDAPGPALDERALFHLLNLARQTGGHILISSEADPAQWRVALPDLASRLKALPVARLDPPDDALLRGVLVKLFADRQLPPDAEVLRYVVARVERRFEVLARIVDTLDRAALAAKRPVTLPFARAVLRERDLFDQSSEEPRTPWILD